METYHRLALLRATQDDGEGTVLALVGVSSAFDRDDKMINAFSASLTICTHDITMPWESAGAFRSSIGNGNNTLAETPH
jgi:hypothetical protein